MNLKIELWKKDDTSMWWPKLITEPSGNKYVVEWDENSMDLRPIMSKYIGQEIDIYTQMGTYPKEHKTEKLIKVDKISFETE